MYEIKFKVWDKKLKILVSDLYIDTNGSFYYIKNSSDDDKKIQRI